MVVIINAEKTFDKIKQQFLIITQKSEPGETT